MGTVCIRFPKLRGFAENGTFSGNRRLTSADGIGIRTNARKRTALFRIRKTYFTLTAHFCKKNRGNHPKIIVSIIPALCGSEVTVRPGHSPGEAAAGVPGGRIRPGTDHTPTEKCLPLK